MDKQVSYSTAGVIGAAALAVGYLTFRLTASDGSKAAPAPSAVDSSAVTSLVAATDALKAIVQRDAADQARKETQAKELKLEVSRLRLQLEAAKTGAGSGAGSAAPSLTRGVSTLSNGETVAIQEHELVRLRAIFNLFDEDHSGTIGASEIKALHAKLGEPITDAEASTAALAMNARDGQVDFESFVRWWNKMHVNGTFGDRKGARYAARFKFLKAKLRNPKVAAIYCKPDGVEGTPDYRMRFYTKVGGVETQVSPWHSIPLRNSNGTYNFVVEIPKWTRKKYEISTTEEFNPIKQDVKHGFLREYQWGDMLFNYGAFPQTWEDPEHVTPDTGAIGDNDPIDVVELGGRSWPVGSVVQVKVLGVLALIDSGETDWKVIAINVEDPLADAMNDVADVESVMPGAISALREWLRNYKTKSGGPTNAYAFGGACKSRDYTETVIQETHEFWKARMEKAEEGSA